MRGLGPGGCLELPQALASLLHPTMKPVILVQQAIENSSQPGDVVLDLFLRSGSSLIGCECNGRVCYGLELEPKHVDVAVMRWEAFTGAKARKEGK